MVSVVVSRLGAAVCVAAMMASSQGWAPARADTPQMDFYVAPPGQGNDTNSCLSAASACASFARATVAASEYLEANPDTDVFVLAEPGVYNNSTGVSGPSTPPACSNGSTCPVPPITCGPTVCPGAGPSTCDTGEQTCTAMQMIWAVGTPGYPITIENDPANPGSVVIERPADSVQNTQLTPLLAVYDSAWVNIEGLQLVGAATTGCSDGTCALPDPFPAACAVESLVEPAQCGRANTATHSDTGEMSITYSEGDAPGPDPDSGISLENVSISGTAFTCLRIDEAEYVTVDGSQLTGCGMPDELAEDAILLNAGEETVSDTTIQGATGYGIYGETLDPSDPATGQTVTGDTIEGSGQFAANSVDPDGDDETVFTDDYIASNSGGGVDVDQDTTLDSNTFYDNGGDAVYLDPSATEASEASSAAGCPAPDTIDNNTFYEDGAELGASSNADQVPELQYNVFYVGAGRHVTDGNVVSSCQQPAPEVDSNDYYDESSASPGFDYGTNALYENPDFSSSAPATASDLTVNNPDLANALPAWGANAAPTNPPDPTLAQTQLLDSNSNPIAGANLVIYAQPLSQSICSSGCPQVGTGVSDGDGYILAGLDLSGIQGSSAYDANDVVELDVYTKDSSGNPAFAERVDYPSGDYDTALETKQLLDVNGSPLNGETVRVLALPLGSSGGSPVQLGTGVADAEGHAYATVDSTPIVNNPAYLTPNSVAQLEVDYQDASGNWHETAAFPEYVGGDNDPVLLTKPIYADGSPVSGADVEAYAVPIGTTGTGTTGYPLLAEGTTDPNGAIHMAALDLTGVQQNPTYEGSDDTIDVRIVYDGCAAGADANPTCTADPPGDDWEYAFDVDEYFGTSYDPVLAARQVLNADGSPLADEPVAVEAVPQPGSGAPPVTLATAATDANGYVEAPLDLTGLEGDTSYESAANLTLNLEVVPSGGITAYSDTPGGGVEAGVSMADPLPTGGLGCDTSQDPTAGTAAMAEACGYSVSPAFGAEPLPGGGTDTTYYVDGSLVDEPQAPVGFNPITASDDQLAEYGFPPRPSQSDTEEYAEWVGDMSGVTEAAAPAFVASPDSNGKTAPTCPNHVPPYPSWCADTLWAGYVVHDKANDFTQTYMKWTQPTMTSDLDCSSKPQSDSIWTGLGGFESHVKDGVLAQDGTANDDGAYQFWWEIYKDAKDPGGPYAFGPSLSADQIVHMNTEYAPPGVSMGAGKKAGKHGAFKFWAANDSTKHKVAVPEVVNLRPGHVLDSTSADFVVEDRGGSNHYPLQEFYTGSTPRDRRLHIKAAETDGESAKSNGFALLRLDLYGPNKKDRLVHPLAVTTPWDKGSKGDVFDIRDRACK